MKRKPWPLLVIIAAWTIGVGVGLIAPEPAQQRGIWLSPHDVPWIHATVEAQAGRLPVIRPEEQP